MNVNAIKLALARWVKNSLPYVITDNAGTFTAGTIVVTINGTGVSQAFITDKNTTLTALAAKITLLVPEVLTAVYDASAHTITITSLGSISLTIVVSLAGITGTMTVVVTSTVFTWERQNAPRPALPYISGHVSLSSVIGQDYVGRSSSDTIDITGNREIVLMLQGYGPNSIQSLLDLRASLEKPMVIATLRSNILAFIDDNGGVHDVSVLLDSQDEIRAALDLRFRTHEQVTDRPGRISTVIANEIIYDLDLSTITLDTITIQ